MAWKNKEVEKLPVPKEVDEAFRTAHAKQQGARRASGASLKMNWGSEAHTKARAAARKAAEVEAEALKKAASHFGGDEAKMLKHFGRWLRSGGQFMGAAEMVLPKESYEGAMRSAEDTAKKMNPGIKKAHRNAPKRGRA